MNFVISFGAHQSFSDNPLLFQGSDELTGPGTPFRKNPECCGKWHIHRMHTLGRQDVYRSGHCVGTEGTSTVKEPFFNSSTISAGTSASSISARQGAKAGSSA